MVSNFTIRPFEVIRGLFLGIAFILSILTLVFLAEFAHNHSLQGRALVFEVLGLLVGPLSLLVLPLMIIHWRFVENSLSVVSEILIISALWGLWMAYLIIGFILQDQLYPIPDYIERRKGINGCQFLPPGPEVHRCHSLIVASEIPIGIVSILLDYFLMLLISSIIIHRRGEPIWTQPVKTAHASWKWHRGLRSSPTP